MFAECIKAVRAVPASVAMYRVHETGWERAEGGRIKNTEGRREKEDDGATGGSATMRLKAYVPLRRGGLTFRGGEGVGDGTRTRVRVHTRDSARSYMIYARRRHTNVVRSEP